MVTRKKQNNFPENYDEALRFQERIRQLWQPRTLYEMEARHKFLNDKYINDDTMCPLEENALLIEKKTIGKLIDAHL